MKKNLALIVIGLSCYTVAHGATTLQIDFSTAAGAQTNWKTIGGTGSPSGTFPGITDLSAGSITVSLTNINFDRTYKNGGADDFPGTDLDAMYGDLLFRNNNTAPISITVSGLLSGTYRFTTHHLNAPNTPSQFDLRVQDADSPAFGQFVGNFTMGQGNATFFSPTIATFDVQSNGTDNIILVMDATFIGTGGNTGGWWGINGMEIELIPEPSTALLGTLGLLALFRRRR